MENKCWNNWEVLARVISQAISLAITYGDLNGIEYSDARKEAAKDFILKELSMKQQINILSTKLSKSSPILWVELEEPEIVDSILIQSPKVDIMYDM